MESRAHSGSNVTGVYKRLYVAQSLKVMAQHSSTDTQSTAARSFDDQ
jgi:hypothetical protein